MIAATNAVVSTSIVAVPINGGIGITVSQNIFSVSPLDRHLHVVNTPQYANARGDRGLSMVGRTLHGDGGLSAGEHFGHLALSANDGPITVGQELRLLVRPIDDKDTDSRGDHLRQVGVGTVDRVLLVQEMDLKSMMGQTPAVEAAAPYDREDFVEGLRRNKVARDRHARRVAREFAERNYAKTIENTRLRYLAWALATLSSG
jgi:hypothetical protein